MIKRLFRTVALIIGILIVPPQQSAPACLVATSDLVTSLADAQAGPRCLDIPAGTYAVPNGGWWLNVTVPNVEIRGAGEGKTILQVTNGYTLTTDLVPIRLAAPNAYVHDLTIQIGTGYHGTNGIGGILIDQAATHARVERVEVAGGYTGNGSNGYGIGTFKLYSSDNAAQYATIQDCFVHDSPATAIGINSNNNTILHNHLKNIGTTGLQHGFYAQGGGNLYDGNIVENVSGYAYHGWKKVPNLDGSGDRIVNNLFSGYGSGPVIVSGMPNAVNPALPTGTNLTRDVVIANNVFRGVGVLNMGVPALISGNVLDGARIEVAAGGDGSRVVGNQIGSMLLQGTQAMLISAPALVQGNTIDMNGYIVGMLITGNGAQIRDNRITRTATGTADWMVAINANANDLDIGGNSLALNGGQLISASHAVTGLRLHDNQLISTRFAMRDGAYFSGVAYDNQIVGIFQSGALVLRDNN